MRFSEGYNAVKVFMSLYKEDKATLPAAVWMLWKKAGIVVATCAITSLWRPKWCQDHLRNLSVDIRNGEEKMSTVSSSWREWLENASHSLFQTHCQSDAWLHPKFDALASFGSIFITGEEIYKLTGQCLSETYVFLILTLFIELLHKKLYPHSHAVGLNISMAWGRITVHWEAILADDLVSDHHRQGWRGRCLAVEVGCRSFASQSLCIALVEFGITGEKSHPQNG